MRVLVGLCKPPILLAKQTPQEVGQEKDLPWFQFCIFIACDPGKGVFVLFFFVPILSPLTRWDAHLQQRQHQSEFCLSAGRGSARWDIYYEGQGGRRHAELLHSHPSCCHLAGFTRRTRCSLRGSIHVLHTEQ